MNKVRFQAELMALKDEGYKEFNQKLIPNVPAETMIGIRTPVLRNLAKRLFKERQAECMEFLEELPHCYFEENNLHAFLIEQMGDFEETLDRTEAFLPYIDNWATCDSFLPKVFKKRSKAMLPRIKKWLESGETYTIRYGVGLLLSNYLDTEFQPEYLEWAAAIQSEEYYVKMMIAWYFSMALVKQYDAALPLIKARRLESWTHNKAIQKARESRQISPERKEYLKTLKV